MLQMPLFHFYKKQLRFRRYGCEICRDDTFHPNTQEATATITSYDHLFCTFICSNLRFHRLDFLQKCMKNAYSMLTKSCPRSSRTGTNNMTTHTSSQRLLGKSQTLIVLKNDRFELWLTPPAIHPLVTF